MKKGCLWVIGIFVILFLIGMCAGSGDKKEQAPAVDTVDVSVDDAGSSAGGGAAATSAKKTWSHDEKKDEMRGNIDTWDYIYSDNTVQFDFPYQGGSQLRIDIRHMKKYGTDVILTITKGQFGGNEYSGTNYVSIKFDGGPIKKYYFNEPADASADCIFLKKTSELISKFKSAHSIMIEAPFYEAGSQVFKFNVDTPYKGK